jgi:hypothetical protein
VDIIIDTTQPRVFLSMLGLPGSDIPRNVRGKTVNVTIKDVRTNLTFVQCQPSQQAQALGKSKWALRFSRDGVVWLERSCEIFDHFSSGGVNAEGMTYVASLTLTDKARTSKETVNTSSLNIIHALTRIHRYFCDVPVDAINGIRKSAVHVYLTKHRDGANLHAAPFTFDGPNGNR